MNDKVGQTYDLRAALFQDRILLFGRYYGEQRMFEFTTEAEYESDLSSDPLLPGNLSQGSWAVVEGGRILAAVGCN